MLKVLRLCAADGWIDNLLLFKLEWARIANPRYREAILDKIETGIN